VTDVAAESKSYRDFAEGYMLTRDGMRWFTNHYLESAGEAQDLARFAAARGVARGSSAGARHHRGLRPAARRGRGLRVSTSDAGVQVDYINYGG